MSVSRVIVTGAASGIGRATAERLLACGHAVLGIDRDAAGLDKTFTGLRAQYGDSADRLVLDLSDSAEIEGTIGRHEWCAGALQGLVNNAALAVQQPFVSLETAAMQAVWQVNMLAPMLMIRACLPALQRGCGAIVNMSSVATRRPHPTYSLYAASKAFLECMTRHLATELGPLGVRINAVSPGGVQTELMDKVNREKGITPEAISEVTSKIPLEQRWAKPEEIAECVLFALFGPRYLHGETIRVDGGL